MEIKKIMDADILDIIFEGRNKEYGAYDLRKSYNRRLIKALMSTAVILVLLFTGYFLSGMTKKNANKPLAATDVILDDFKTKKEEVLPPPQLPKPEPQKVAMKQFTPPKLVDDKDVKEDEKPPEQDKLVDTKIGVVNQDGLKDDGIMAPPVSGDGKNVVEAPKKAEEDYDGIFTKVEIESDYPGGPAAWLRYLNKNLRYPEEALSINVQGTVVVQFIVDKDGNVSDVEAVSGPTEGGLREEAIRVIKKSGKWTPAEQNGRKVKSYKKQPVGFKAEQG